MYLEQLKVKGFRNVVNKSNQIVSLENPVKRYNKVSVSYNEITVCKIERFEIVKFEIENIFIFSLYLKTFFLF